MTNEIKLNTGEKQVMAQLQVVGVKAKPKLVREAWKATKAPSGIRKMLEEMVPGALHYYLFNAFASSSQSADGTEEVDDNSDDDEDDESTSSSSDSSDSSS